MRCISRTSSLSNALAKLNETNSLYRREKKNNYTATLRLSVLNLLSFIPFLSILCISCHSKALNMIQLNHLSSIWKLHAFYLMLAVLYLFRIRTIFTDRNSGWISIKHWYLFLKRISHLREYPVVAASIHWLVILLQWSLLTLNRLITVHLRLNNHCAEPVLFSFLLPMHSRITLTRFAHNSNIDFRSY